MSARKTGGSGAGKSKPVAAAKAAKLTVDDYLASAPAPAKAALSTLRKAILSAAPKAEEVMHMGAPTYKIGASRLVSFGFAAKHCAFYVMSGDVMKAHAKELEEFDTAPTAIRFKPDKPLSAGLVRAIVKARLVELR